MKPSDKKLLGAKLRLRPGGQLFLRPPLLRRWHWSPDDALFLQIEQGRAFLIRKPSEREWRIRRLQARTRPACATTLLSAGFLPRSLAQFRALKPSPWRVRGDTAHDTVGAQGPAAPGFLPGDVLAVRVTPQSALHADQSPEE